MFKCVGAFKWKNNWLPNKSTWFGIDYDIIVLGDFCNIYDCDYSSLCNTHYILIMPNESSCCEQFALLY
jgi:hypothetical protein